MNTMSSFGKTDLAASLVVLLAVSSGAAGAQAPATQSRQGDNAWPTESAAAVSFGVPGSEDAPQLSATVSFFDPVAAVDGAPFRENAEIGGRRSVDAKFRRPQCEGRWIVAA